MKKIIKWLIVIGIILLLSGGIYVIYRRVIFPSYLSVRNACYGLTDEEIKEKFGYTLGGTFDPSTDEIIIYINDSKVLKHENCHLNQQTKGKLNSCDSPIGLFFNEIECNIVQYF